MSSSAQTRGQMVAYCDRLKKRVDLDKLSDKFSKALIDVGKTTLKNFQSSFRSRKHYCHTLLGGSGMFNEKSYVLSVRDLPWKFLQEPTFRCGNALRNLFFYRISLTVTFTIDYLGLPNEDKENKNVKVQAYYAVFLDCDKDYSWCRLVLQISPRLFWFSSSSVNPQLPKRNSWSSFSFWPSVEPDSKPWWWRSCRKRCSWPIPFRSSRHSSPTKHHSPLFCEFFCPGR